MIVIAEEKKKVGRPKGSKNKNTTSKELESAISLLANSKKIPYDKDEITNLLTRPYRCCSCGKRFVKQKGNFSHNSSDNYEGNNNYLPICNSCLEREFNKYENELGNELESIHRICLHWDMYFDEKIYNMCKRQNSNSPLIQLYVSRLNMTQYIDKNYDTYLLEQEVEQEKKETNSAIEINTDKTSEEEPRVKPETIETFGMGYEEEEYLYLQKEYDDWTTRYECKTKSQETIFKNICVTGLMSYKASLAGDIDNVNKCNQALSKLMADGNLKPSQNTEFDNANQESFGVLIKNWEDHDPIPEPEEEWKDIDNIKLYIEVFFLGHLCKMLKIKNTYSKHYEEYIEKYTVRKSTNEEDDSAEYDEALFGGGDSDGE